jgi:UDP-N-acetylmuramate--alanine ligase
VPRPRHAARHIHIVGIGGAGMSPLARILLESGDTVSGSDLAASRVTASLQRLGATVYLGHRPENIAGADLVVTTSAARSDNPELAAATARGIPIIKGAALLGDLMAGQKAICVAGTHGKTTTTAMIAMVLTQAGLDPTYVIGGEPRDLPAAGRLGCGPYFVAEADEFDRRFLALHPYVAVVTSLDHDHPDCYPTITELEAAFRSFVALLPSDGWAVGCGDHQRVKGLMGPRSLTYGLGEGNTWRATRVTPNELGGSDFWAECSSTLAPMQGEWPFRLRVPGIHNVVNALGALAVASLLEIEPERVSAALAEFRGVGRRFEILGDWNGVTVVDDYAHHPNEIRVTLAAARQRFDGRRIVALHQPHTYSRLKALLPEFAEAFGDADQVVVVDVYGSRETDTLGVHASDLAAACHHPAVRYVGGLEQATEYLRTSLRPGDVLVSLGAGDVNKVGKAILCAA